MNHWLNKLLAIACFCFLIVGILIAHQHPATGYELDIYASTPVVTWISVIFGFFGGAGIILYQLITRGYENSKLWLIGFTLIIVSKITLLYIPYIRDYTGWRGDYIGYLGMTQDILLNGHFSGVNIYPITHIFLAETISVTGIPITLIANTSTAMISILFVFFTYLLVGEITQDKRKQMISVIISGAVLITEGYNVILAPNGWSILFMPLLFFLYFKSTQAVYRVLFIIVLVIYPLFHPLSSLIVIVALFIMELIKWLFPRLLKNRLNLPSQSSPFLISYVIIEFVLFSYWILSHTQFNTNIILLWQQITSGLGSEKVAELASSLNKINVHGFDVYILLFKMFGAEIILIIFSSAAILWYLKRIYNRHPLENSRTLLPLSAVFIVCGLLYAAYLLGLPGTEALGTGQWDRRLLGYVDIFLPLFSSIIFIKLLSISNFRNIIRVSTLGLIFLSSILSIGSLFPSPYINQPNLQLTSTDLIGTKWFVDKKSGVIDSTFIMSSPADFAKGIIGYEAAVKSINLGGTSAELANHFGYNEQSSLGAEYPADYYAVITQYDKIIYSTVWKEVGRFDNSDFIKLEHDPTVSKLYSNNGMDVYYIKSSFSS